MVKKQKTKQQSKNLMIKYKFYFSLFFMFFLFLNCEQKNKKNINNVRKVIVKDTINEIKNRIKVIGFFDYDTIKDTIFYSLDNTKNEPIYKCNVFFGNKNTKEFYISTGTGYIQLTNCKKGCIEKSEITTGLFSSEEIEKYLYDEKLNNWFAFETTTKEKDTLINNKIIGEQWSIDDEIIKK